VRVWVDTGALLALSHARDQHHQVARKVIEAHSGAGGRYVGSTLILAEFHTHFLYLRGPASAATALGILLEDPQHEWLGVDADTVREARSNWLLRFADQGFSLTDAVSFELMTREKLTHAFAFDRHFEIAGFELLR
jgi:predicted nucleic acid-binding protein